MTSFLGDDSFFNFGHADVGAGGVNDDVGNVNNDGSDVNNNTGDANNDASDVNNNTGDANNDARDVHNDAGVLLLLRALARSNTIVNRPCWAWALFECHKAELDFQVNSFRYG